MATITDPSAPTADISTAKAGNLPTTETSQPKATEHPTDGTLAAASQLSSVQAPSKEPLPPSREPFPPLNEPNPPALQADPKLSTSAETTDTSTPPFSPSSTTPVLEKEDLDFSGNVDVNDEIPSEKDLKRVGDLLVLDSQGVSRPFKDLYEGEVGSGMKPKQLIIFVRHFFCGNCQEYLRTLSSSISPESLLALPTPTFITVIGCGRPELIDMYVKETNCPFPVYADPTRKLYDYLGMTRTWDLGKKPGYIQSSILITSVQSIVQSLKTGNKALKGGDFKQVGGEFLFENGECIWVHRMRNTRDHSEVTDVRQMLGLDDAKPPMRKRWSHGVKQVKERNRSSSWGRIRSKSRGTKDGKGKETNGSLNEGEELRLNGRPTV